MAQPAQTPPSPQPSEAPPPKPRTATPSEDTGMAGQVADAAVVVPAIGALSTTVILGILAVVGIAALVVGSGGGDDSAPAAPTTTTR